METKKKWKVLSCYANSSISKGEDKEKKIKPAIKSNIVASPKKRASLTRVSPYNTIHLLLLLQTINISFQYTDASTTDEEKENNDDDDSWSQITGTLTVSSAIFVLLNIVFEFGRRDKYFGEVYDRKRGWRSHRTPPPLLKQRGKGSEWWTYTALMEWIFLGWDERYQNFAAFMHHWEVQQRTKKEKYDGVNEKAVNAEEETCMKETQANSSRKTLETSKNAKKEVGKPKSHHRRILSTIHEEKGEEEKTELTIPSSLLYESSFTDFTATVEAVEAHKNLLQSPLSSQNNQKQSNEENESYIDNDNCGVEIFHNEVLFDDVENPTSTDNSKGLVKESGGINTEDKQVEEPAPCTPERRYYLSIYPGQQIEQREIKLKSTFHKFCKTLIQRKVQDNDDNDKEEKERNHNILKICSSSNIGDRANKEETLKNSSYHQHHLPTLLSDDDLPKLPPLEQKLLEYAGLDSYLMIRFTRFGFDCTFYSFLAACIILIPVYYTNDPGKRTKRDDIHGYFRLTINRLEESSLKLWIVWLFAIVFYIMVLVRWYEEWRIFERLRMEFLINGDFDCWVEDDEESLQQYQNSCFVEHIPRKLRHNKDILEFYNQLFPGHVKRADILYNTSKLSNLINQRDHMLAKYERVEAKQIYEERVYRSEMEQNARVAAIPGWKGRCQQLLQRNRRLCGCCWCCFGKMPSEPSPVQIRVEGEKVNALEYYKSEIDRLNGETKKEYQHLARSIQCSESLLETSGRLCVEEEQQRMDEQQKKEEEKDIFLNENYKSIRTSDAWHVRNAQRITELLFASDEFTFRKDANRTTCDCAFVEFTDKSTKQSAIQCNLTGKAHWMDTMAAPDPRDIIWNNATVKRHLILLRRRAIELLLLLGVLFWGVLVAALTNIFNPKTTQVDPIPSNDSRWDTFVRGYLPVLLLSIILLILPVIFRLLGAAVIRFKSGSEVDKFMFTWNVLYRLAQFFTILISGTIFDTIDNLKDSPGNEVESLVNGILSQSPFFFNIVINAIGLETMAQLSQLPRFLFTLLLKYVVTIEATSDRSLEWLREPQFFRFGRFSPPFFYCFLIALVYSATTPLILGVCAVYFYIATKVYTHQVLYVFSQPYEGGGKFMYYFNKLVFVAMYSSIVILATVLTLKNSPEASISFFVLMIFFTFSVQQKIGKEFVDPSKTLPLTNARVIDQGYEMTKKKQDISGPASKDLESQCGSSVDEYNIPSHSEHQGAIRNGVRLRTRGGSPIAKHKSGMGIGQPLFATNDSQEVSDYFIYRQPCLNVKNWKEEPRKYRCSSSIYSSG